MSVSTATSNKKRRGFRSRLGAVGAVAALTMTALMGAACTSSTASDKNAEATVQSSTQESAETEESEALTGILVIYAAASLSGAFDVLTTEFEQMNPNVDVAPPVYDGSSSLVTQILEGAQVDVFASADMANMDTLVDEGMAADDPEVFATNQITVAVPADNPAGITSIDDLADPGVSVVLCAPEVPCGAAASKVLEAAGVAVTPVSSEQSVSAVAAKVASGDADAGMVYVTDVQASDGELEAISTPVDSELLNRYPIAVVKDAPNAAAAEAFIQFVLSDRGQEILAEFGFGRP